MNKLMFCPLAFNRDAYFSNGNKVHKPVECSIPDCAWAVKDKENYWCGIVPWNIHARNNVRPIENE